MRFKTIQLRLICWIASVIWLPTLTLAADVTVRRSALTDSAIVYQNELIIAASLLTAALGTWLAVHWNPPDELAALVRRNTKVVNAISAITGAVAAFIYMLHHEQKLTILHPLWVLGMSFATPLTLQVAIPIGVQVLSEYLAKFKGSGGKQDGT